MNENSNDKKLDWMYKGANSLVDREEYLLGRSVDKALEQLNAEEKEKKLGLVPPKNHVEHECIPPSIRDFNKIVQAEQVDISAKLQEDPLVAIKKREEEARRQFLQNPVQLKKLQEALKAQQLKKKKKKHKSKNSDSDSDLDNKIAKKLKYLKEDPLAVSSSKKQKKKSKDTILDTILMHKFNQLKDKLSQEDLNDILAGNTSDSDEEKKSKLKKRKKTRGSSSEESDKEIKSKKKERGRTYSTSSEEEEPKRTRKWSSSSSNSSKDAYNKGKHSGRTDKDSYRKNGKNFGQERRKEEKGKSLRQNTDYSKRRSRSIERSQQKYSTSSDEAVRKYKGRCEKNYREERETQRKNSSKDNIEKKLVKKESEKYIDKQKDEFESDLESKILKKLRMLRDSVKSKENENTTESDDTESEHRKRKKTMNTKSKKESSSSSDSSSDDSDSENSRFQKPVHQYDSDSDEKNHKPKTFGLVKSDGTKIALNKKPYEVKKADKSTEKMEAVSKSDRKNVKKLTEEEKERIRKEMMKNADKREKERSDNLKWYREEDRREEREAAKFDKGFVHKELLKSTRDATVETRIKSNLNNIQRSSRHMDSSFSRRK